MALAFLIALGPISVAGELLYNGIVLPDVWPPRDQAPRSPRPMSVPYLASHPAVVPIDVGRQLFVDDFLVERTDLRRVWHQAQPCTENPILTAQTPEELGRSTEDGEHEAVVYLGNGGVFYDPADRRFKMWYTAGWRGGLAYAESRDARHWTRPALDAAGRNLLLPRGLATAGWDNSVWLDLAAADPRERIKLLTQRDGGIHALLTSGDGRAWSPDTVAGKSADYSSFFYNPFRRKWVHSIKRNGPRGRTRHYAESADFRAPGVYDRSVYWVGADELDAPDPAVRDTPQLYALNAVAYESVLLGLFAIHLGPANEVCERGRFPKLTELKLGFSRDGFHWDRPDRRAFLAPSQRPGAWDRGYLHGTTGVCLVLGDRLLFLYTAYSGESPSGWKSMYSGASIGAATLRRDGFASLEAGPEGGTITTRPVVFDGTRLFVNVAAPAGELRVEILDEAGAPLAPFTREACVPVAADSTLQPVAWRGGADLSALRGRVVRFRFHLRNGGLYAFWVSPDDSGASRGYVAAGGPGYPGTVDTVGAAAYRSAADAGAGSSGE